MCALTCYQRFEQPRGLPLCPPGLAGVDMQVEGCQLGAAREAQECSQARGWRTTCRAQWEPALGSGLHAQTRRCGSSSSPTKQAVAFRGRNILPAHSCRRTCSTPPLLLCTDAGFCRRRRLVIIVVIVVASVILPEHQLDLRNAPRRCRERAAGAHRARGVATADAGQDVEQHRMGQGCEPGSGPRTPARGVFLGT